MGHYPYVLRQRIGGGAGSLWSSSRRAVGAVVFAAGQGGAMLSRAGLLGWAGLAAVVMLAGPALAGPRWDWFKWFRPKKLQSPASQVGPEQARPAQAGPLEGTIGSVAYIRGLRTMVVRGYGVVAGLGKNGSKECPPSIRNYLTQQIAKRYRLGSVSSGLAWLRPEDLLADLDTAVVMVTGRIPAAAQPGTRFDVQVEALPRTQTRSLANGRLYTCELKLYRGGLASELVGARTLARAAGPIFVNPFAESSGSANALRATVLGGGVTLEPRRIQLVLIVPSYQLASRVRDRINERFGADPPTADAISPSLIRLRIPKAWRGAEEHFLGLLTHLYLYDDPSAAEQ
ncbi:MAG: flagellar basal body P-ring protein FlgI, partial [Phycisphaerae bacterium]